MLNKSDETVLNKIKNILLETGIVESIILFGSRAYGNSSTENSDYDILIISKKELDWQEQDHIFDLLYTVQLDYDVILDLHFLAKAEINTIRGRQPIFQKALEEGLNV
ncbi:MAG: nucleotidyltransferase domain-containing protein [Candidatus Delongbacteria bacterium]|jgi:predicted nucleotidyltransferase|nr:nucleotidyltransferase domain-containing protein [Candidatus Delongbacteria bacterium]